MHEDHIFEQTARDLAANGFARIDELHDEQSFTKIAERLGVIYSRADIVVDHERLAAQRDDRDDAKKDRASQYQAGEFELHCDSPLMKYLAFHCIRQDEDGGATLLVDTADIADEFSEDELTALGSVRITYMVSRPGGEDLYDHPMVSRRGDRWALYYVPWNLPAPADLAQAALLDRVAAYVRRKERNDLIPVRLEPGQSFFLDNHRLLHGRGRLLESSKRHLVRLYILADEAAEA